MQHLIKDGQPMAQDPWHWVEDASSLPDNAPVILPLSLYRDQREEWLGSGRQLGVWLDAEAFAEDVEPYLAELELIALHLPKFADGRSFSKARLIRERLGFNGELRAIGDFLPDQAFYLMRCGVNAFACRTAEEAEATLRLLDTFSVRYQTDVDSPALFEQRPAD